jgi:hypothetical protein
MGLHNVMTEALIYNHKISLLNTSNPNTGRVFSMSLLAPQR